MNENLVTKWWTPVSLRGVVSFAWISLLITSLMCGISWMRGDDTGTSISLMVLIANSVIVWILPEDVPARPVPEKFGLFVVCGASMTVLSTNYLFHRSGTNIGLTLVVALPMNHLDDLIAAATAAAPTTNEGDAIQ